MVMTCFDDLNIDLLLKILTYPSFTKLFEFFDLQKCLDDAFKD